MVPLKRHPSFGLRAGFLTVFPVLKGNAGCCYTFQGRCLEPLMSVHQGSKPLASKTVEVVRDERFKCP